MTSRLIGTGLFRPPVLVPSKGQSGVLSVAAQKSFLNSGYHDSQPPGSRPRASRVASHGKQLAPFRWGFTTLQGIQSTNSLPPCRLGDVKFYSPWSNDDYFEALLRREQLDLRFFELVDSNWCLGGD